MREWRWMLVQPLAVAEAPPTGETEECEPHYSYGSWRLVEDERAFEEDWVVSYEHYERTVTEVCSGDSRTQTKVEGPFQLWPAVPHQYVREVSQPTGSAVAPGTAPLATEHMLVGQAVQVGPDPSGLWPLGGGLLGGGSGIDGFVPGLTLLTGALAYSARQVRKGSSGAAGAGTQNGSLSPWQRLLYFGKGVGKGVLNLVEGVATLAKMVVVDLPQHLARRFVTNIERLRTMPLQDALAANFADDVADWKAVGRGAWGVVSGIFNDARTVVVGGYRAFTDATVTAADMEHLGESTFSTALNFVGGAGAVKTVAKVGKLGKIAYTTEVAVKVTTSDATVLGAQTSRVLVQGENAAKLAKQLAAAKNRRFLAGLPRYGDEVARARGIQAQGAVGEQAAADLAARLGAPEQLYSKFPANRGVDVMSASRDGTRAIFAEAKTTRDVWNILKVKINKLIPERGAVQGTPQYNKGYLERMRNSGDPRLQESAARLRRSLSEEHLAISLNEQGLLRVVNGETLQAAVRAGGVARGGGSVVSGVIRPQMTLAERLTLGVPVGAPVLSEVGDQEGSAAQTPSKRSSAFDAMPSEAVE